MNQKTKIASKKMTEENSNHEEFSNPIWSEEEKLSSNKIYGCEVMGEKCTDVELKNKNLPNDTYIISYYQEGKLFRDLVRGKRVKIFDMYYDKLGKDSITDIDFGYGVISPKLWGVESPKQKKRK